jgi:hypothetical protein
VPKRGWLSAGKRRFSATGFPASLLLTVMSSVPARCSSTEADGRVSPVASGMPAREDRCSCAMLGAEMLPGAQAFVQEVTSAGFGQTAL